MPGCAGLWVLKAHVRPGVSQQRWEQEARRAPRHHTCPAAAQAAEVRPALKEVSLKGCSPAFPRACPPSENSQPQNILNKILSKHFFFSFFSFRQALYLKNPHNTAPAGVGRSFWRAVCSTWGHQSNPLGLLWPRTGGCQLLRTCP